MNGRKNIKGITATMNLTKQIQWLVLLALIINAAGLITPIINAGDSVTYAALSQHIALSGDWASLVLDGEDWLDKPHMPFWITALFFKLGGISAFTYNLPGFLFHLIGGYYTYRIARLFYGRDTAWLALLVYVSTYHLMYTSSEIKAETYLTGSIMAACYYWLSYDAQTRIKYLLLGAAFSAVAVMTKGVFTLITISSGLVCMWMYQKQWRKLWSFKWLFAFVLCLVFTAPEMIALYLQFDAHPEKVMFGHAHVSGIKFFLWDSQFGRFFNTGPIKNQSGNPLYFVHVFLWAFLPWVAVFVATMIDGVRKFAARSASENAQFVFLCGAFFVTFLLFSATSFQLDYYTVILFPFAAILCGKYLADWLGHSGEGRKLIYTQLVTTLLVICVAIGLSIYIENMRLLAVVLVMLLVWTVYGYITRRQMRSNAVVVFPVLSIVTLYTFLVVMATTTNMNISVAYKANQQLAGKPSAPVYVYGMYMVTRELALLNPAPCMGIYDPNALPKGQRYYLVLTQENLDAFAPRLGRFEVVGGGDWSIQRTGVFPVLLHLAKGDEPLDRIRVIEVKGSL